VGNSRLGKVIGGNIKELAYYTIAFQQITEEQVQSWSRDANQYVADEDDVTYSCRVSGTNCKIDFLLTFFFSNAQESCTSIYFLLT